MIAVVEREGRFWIDRATPLRVLGVREDGDAHRRVDAVFEVGGGRRRSVERDGVAEPGPSRDRQGDVLRMQRDVGTRDALNG